MSLKKEYKEIEDFFEAPPDLNQKAWGLIHEFYHIVLTYMDNKNISKADLARKLGKSRASISQMFNKTPNLSVKRMVEIAEAIGVELSISTNNIEDFKNVKIVKETEYVPVLSSINWQIMQATNKISPHRTIKYDSNSLGVEFCSEDVSPS